MKTSAEQQSMTEVAALALRVGQERQQKLHAMRKAFEDGDLPRATDLARELCGIKNKEQAQQ